MRKIVFLLLSGLLVGNTYANTPNYKVLNGSYYSEKTGILLFFHGTKEAVLTRGANACGASLALRPITKQKNTFKVKIVGDAEGFGCPDGIENMKITIMNTNQKTKVATKIKVSGLDKETQIYTRND